MTRHRETHRTQSDEADPHRKPSRRDRPARYRERPVYEARVTELGITLPGPFPPHDPLDAVVMHAGTARTSGCLPRTTEGVLHATGLLGQDLTVDVGVECAELCAWNALSLLRAALGSLDVVERTLT